MFFLHWFLWYYFTRECTGRIAVIFSVVYFRILFTSDVYYSCTFCESIWLRKKSITFMSTAIIHIDIIFTRSRNIIFTNYYNIWLIFEMNSMDRTRRKSLWLCKHEKREKRKEIIIISRIKKCLLLYKGEPYNLNINQKTPSNMCIIYQHETL